MWEPVLRDLAHGRRVLAYDLRGHGAATDAPPPADLRTLADDLQEVLDHEQLTGAHVVGLSYGGAVAQTFAVHHRESVLSLTLAATTDRAFASFEQRASAIETDGPAAQVAALPDPVVHARSPRRELPGCALRPGPRPARRPGPGRGRLARLLTDRRRGQAARPRPPRARAVRRAGRLDRSRGDATDGRPHPGQHLPSSSPEHLTCPRSRLLTSSPRPSIASSPVTTPPLTAHRRHRTAHSPDRPPHQEGHLMYAMQYEITLPADYDMQIIRTRVATGGSALDDLPGLGLKAYAIRERGVDNSPVNQYAPIYLWNDTGAMARFLGGGGGFQNIIRDFGRPVVRHWTGLACHAGTSRAPHPTSASRRLTPIPIDPDQDATGLGLTTVIEQALEDLRRLARHEQCTRPRCHRPASLATGPLRTVERGRHSRRGGHGALRGPARVRARHQRAPRGPHMVTSPMRSGLPEHPAVTTRLVVAPSGATQADEHCRVDIHATGLSLHGTVLGAESGTPVRAEYHVVADSTCLSTTVHVRFQRGLGWTERTLVRAPDGHWTVDGLDAPLPSTNTLPPTTLPPPHHQPPSIPLTPPTYTPHHPTPSPLTVTTYDEWRRTGMAEG